MESLKFSDTDDQGNHVFKNVPRGQTRLITVVFDYVTYKSLKGEPIGDAWMAITAEDFDGFRSSTKYPLAREGYRTAAYFGTVPSGFGNDASASRSMNSEERRLVEQHVLDEPPTNKVSPSSLVRLAVDTIEPILRDDRPDGEDSVRPNIEFGSCDESGRPDTTPDNTQIVFDAPTQSGDKPDVALVFWEDLIGKPFISDSDLDGQRLRESAFGDMEDGDTDEEGSENEGTEDCLPTDEEKDDLFQDSWRHDFAIQTKAQGLDNVIDLFPSYSVGFGEIPEEEIIFEDTYEIDIPETIAVANAHETRLAFRDEKERRRHISMRRERLGKLVPNARWDGRVLRTQHARSMLAQSCELDHACHHVSDNTSGAASFGGGPNNNNNNNNNRTIDQ